MNNYTYFYVDIYTVKGENQLEERLRLGGPARRRNPRYLVLRMALLRCFYRGHLLFLHSIRRRMTGKRTSTSHTALSVPVGVVVLPPWGWDALPTPGFYLPAAAAHLPTGAPSGEATRGPGRAGCTLPFPFFRLDEMLLAAV